MFRSNTLDTKTIKSGYDSVLH